MLFLFAKIFICAIFHAFSISGGHGGGCGGDGGDDCNDDGGGGDYGGDDGGDDDHGLDIAKYLFGIFNRAVHADMEAPFKNQLPSLDVLEYFKCF